MKTLHNSINREITMCVRARFLTLLFSIGVLFSCEDFVDIGPPMTQIVSSTVYSNDATAISAMSGIYSEMMRSGFASGLPLSVTVLTGLSSDELVYSSISAQIQEFNTNSLSTNNSEIDRNLWGSGYKHVFQANSLLEGLASSKGLTNATKMQLEGEAKFVRAFCLFYLTNLFGDIPIVTTSQFEVNSKISRSPQSLVYEQIIKDLQDSQEKLGIDYAFSTNERVRANKYAASALLARVYLYTQNWSAAEAQATTVIDNTTLYSLNANLNTVFLKNSSEAIWQLKPVVPGSNTNEGKTFINTTAVVFSLSNQFMNSFESGDARRANWIGSVINSGATFYHAHKYKIAVAGQPLTEYPMVLRLAEQYLIRAEARTQQGNISGAQADLNMIRNRAGLANTIATDKSSLLLATEQERKVELFAEWGHRWLDLKRMGRVDVVLAPVKLDWQSTDALYPIPQSELNVNKNLLPQNPGY